LEFEELNQPSRALRNTIEIKRVVVSLKTKSSDRAATASRIMLYKLEDYRLGLRLKDIKVPAAHLLRSQATINLNSNLICLSEALEIYPRSLPIQEYIDQLKALTFKTTFNVSFQIQ
jgi:hypothetical protein